MNDSLDEALALHYCNLYVPMHVYQVIHDDCVERSNARFSPVKIPITWLFQCRAQEERHIPAKIEFETIEREIQATKSN